MTKRIHLATVLAATLLSACTYDIAAVRESEPRVGSWPFEFTQAPRGASFEEALAREYKVLTLFENDEMYDYTSAGQYAERVLSLQKGETVDPARLEDFDLPADHLPALEEARATVMTLFDEGVREAWPAESARLQSSFDCWVEQQEENHQPDDIARCRVAYNEALGNLRVAMTPPPEPVVQDEEPVVATAPAPAVEYEDSYTVYFDFNSAELNEEALGTLETVVDALRALNAGASIVGHADTSGAVSYNQSLSEARAEAVSRVLQDAGIRPSVVTISGLGETDLAVATGDNVREALNRRAVINIR